MPEVTAAELRRLEGLSARIVRADDRLRVTREQRDEAREEVKQLKARVRELERTNRDLIKSFESDASATSDQVDELIGENQRLADELSTAQKTADQVTTQAAKLATVRDDLKVQVADLKTESKALSSEVKTLTKSNTGLSTQLATATAQLETSEQPVFIAPDQVGGLLDDFVNKIDIGGLEVNEGDIRLNVAFAAAGDAAGFVIPSTAADDDLPLHTINLNLVKRAPTVGE